jgi:hypothetical protein
MSKPTTGDLSRIAGISKSYASEILNGRKDQPNYAPSRSLAIYILRATGWRHECIADLTEEQMAVLEQVDPWTPRQAA